MANESIPKIRTIHNQLGLTVEASIDGGKTWQTVQSRGYRIRESNGTRPYSTYIDPASDERDYFAHLDARGIRYERIHSA